MVVQYSKAKPIANPWTAFNFIFCIINHFVFYRGKKHLGNIIWNRRSQQAAEKPRRLAGKLRLNLPILKSSLLDRIFLYSLHFLVNILLPRLALTFLSHQSQPFWVARIIFAFMASTGANSLWWILNPPKQALNLQLELIQILLAENSTIVVDYKSWYFDKRLSEHSNYDGTAANVQSS